MSTNAVLEGYLRQRGDQLATIDALLEQVDGRDLVEAEVTLLESAKQRITKLDDLIGPLRDIEAARGAQIEVARSLPQRPAEPTRRLDGNERAPLYSSPGDFLVDYIRSRGFMERSGGAPDSAAQARVAQAYQSRAVSNQITTDVPGILPTPIVGTVVNLLDAARPLIASLGGALPLAGIPGATFTRPKITTHTQVGAQAAQKGELPSRAMKIDPITFTKTTRGGTVDVSRQTIDWTSPAAWDILVRDLADVYAVDTETTVSAAFKTAAIGTAVTVADDTLASWADALYKAAATSYSAGRRMPDRIWVSLDVWAALGALVDAARLVLPPTPSGVAGASELGSFRGDVIGLPRIVVPTFASGTCIVGPANLFEVYEESIGLLSVVEPSILGVQVAYGGYIAFGSLAGPAFVPVTAPAGMTVIEPVSLDTEAESRPANPTKAAK